MPTRWQSSVYPSARSTAGPHRHVLRSSRGLCSHTTVSSLISSGNRQMDLHRQRSLRVSSAALSARLARGQNRSHDHGLLVARSMKLNSLVPSQRNKASMHYVSSRSTMNASAVQTQNKMEIQLQHHRERVQSEKRDRQLLQPSLVIRSQHEQVQQHLLCGKPTITTLDSAPKLGASMQQSSARNPCKTESPPNTKNTRTPSTALPTTNAGTPTNHATASSGSMWTSRMSRTASKLPKPTPTKRQLSQVQAKDNSWMTTIVSPHVKPPNKAIKSPVRKVVQVRGGSTNKQLAAAKKAFRENASKRARVFAKSQKNVASIITIKSKQKKRKQKKIRSPGSPNVLRNVQKETHGKARKKNNARSNISEVDDSDSTHDKLNFSRNPQIAPVQESSKQELHSSPTPPLNSPSSPTLPNLSSDSSISDSTISDDRSDSSETSQDLANVYLGNEDEKLSTCQDISEPSKMNLAPHSPCGGLKLDLNKEKEIESAGREPTITRTIQQAAAMAKIEKEIESAGREPTITRTIQQAAAMAKIPPQLTDTRTPSTFSSPPEPHNSLEEKKSSKLTVGVSLTYKATSKRAKRAERKPKSRENKKTRQSRPQTSPLAAPPPAPQIRRKSSLDTGLEELRQAGFTVVTTQSSVSSKKISNGSSSERKLACRRPPAPIDTGLGELKKKGFVVVRKKSQSSTGKQKIPKPTISVEEQERVSAQRAAEAAKRVQQHRLAAAKKKNSDSPQQEAQRARTEQRTLAEKNRLVKRARIYAVNCVMKAYRLVQIKALQDCPNPTESVVESVAVVNEGEVDAPDRSCLAV